MKHCETCRCEEVALRDAYYAGFDVWLSRIAGTVLQFHEAMDKVRFAAGESASRRDELREWVAVQNLAPEPAETWRPYRPELAAPFYGRESRP